MNSSIKKWIPESWFKSYKKYKRKKIMLHDSKETHQYAEIVRTKRTGKIKIAFIVYMPEVWNSLKSVHDAAYKDDKIETIIVAQPWISKLGESNQIFKNEAFEFLKESYEDVVNAYDVKQNSWFDLEAFQPDFVFYTRPYNVEYYQKYKPENVRKYAELCWVPYGYDVARNHLTESSYNVDFLRYITYLFAPSKSIEIWAKKKYAIEVKKGYLQIEYIGFPRFDLYAEIKAQKKQTSDKTTVLWTPRWTSENKGIMKSNFLNYYKNFFEFAKNHPEFSVVIRPHPLMFENYIRNEIMTKAEVENMRKICKKIGNIEFDEKKDYFLSIQNADIFVTDFSSLMAEFFATERPIIYCDKSDEFSPECKKMDAWFTHADSWDEIEAYMLKYRENAPNMDIADKKEILPINMGNIGSDIINYLKKKL